MAIDNDVVFQRIDELERRLEALEQRIVDRPALDEEIRSLEQRLTEVRETTEG